MKKKVKRTCWKCSNDGFLTTDSEHERVSRHEIKGHNTGYDESICLCVQDHNYVESYCGRCINQRDCTSRIFKDCWKTGEYPIHFRFGHIDEIEDDKEESVENNLIKGESLPENIKPRRYVNQKFKYLIEKLT